MRIVQEETQGAYVVTIGNFDGVHLGHQSLLEEAQSLASKRGVPSLAMTFDPHPSLVLKGPRTGFLITPLDLKLHYLERAGVDAVAVLPFTPEFARMPAEEFLERVLHGRFQAQGVVVGYNFSFGQGGRGNAQLLADFGEREGIPVVIAPPFLDPEEGRPISSSRIRQQIGSGDMGAAASLLGHPFTVAGEVVQGNQRGRQLGVPTLNLLPPQSQVMPPYGVYAGFLTVQGAVYMAVASWGIRPTFHGEEPLLEVHALSPLTFDHYGQRVQFDWGQRLRGEERFHSPEALKAQMMHDIEEARRWLQSHPRLA